MVCFVQVVIMYFPSFWKCLPIVSLFFDIFITKLNIAQKSSKIIKMSNEALELEANINKPKFILIEVIY